MEEGEGLITQVQFAERLYALRVARDLTLREVGERTGMNTSRIWSYENNKNAPNLDALRRYAKGFGFKELSQFMLVMERK